MRKLIWGCTVAGALWSCGVVGTTYYAWHHPDSFAGRCLRSSASKGCMPLLTSRVMPPSGGEEASEPSGPVEPATAPGEAAPAPAEAGNVQETQPIPPPAADTGLIVIPEEEPAADTKPLDLPATVERRIEPMPMPEGVAVPDAVPMQMPYSEEESEGTTKDEAEARPSVSISDCFLGGVWMRMMKALEARFAAPAVTEEATTEPPVANEPQGHAPTSDPHAGQCTRYQYPQRCSPCVPSGPSTPSGSEEASEEGPRMSSKLDRLRRLRKGDGDRCPTHPEVDTMEYRRSDGNLYDYGTGGPL
jgi:hypothetical protein